MTAPVWVWPPRPQRRGGRIRKDDSAMRNAPSRLSASFRTIRGARKSRAERGEFVSSLRYASNRYRRDSGFSRRQMTLSITVWWMPTNAQPTKKKSAAPKMVWS